MNPRNFNKKDYSKKLSTMLKSKKKQAWEACLEVNDLLYMSIFYFYVLPHKKAYNKYIINYKDNNK